MKSIDQIFTDTEWEAKIIELQYMQAQRNHYPPPMTEKPKCPQCNFDGPFGYLRREVPVDHPDFGKAVPCSHEFHHTGEIGKERLREIHRKLAVAGDIYPQQASIRIADIKPLHFELTGACPLCNGTLESPHDFNHQTRQTCENCKATFYGNPSSNLKMIEAAKNMVADPLGWLYIWGGPGNAKTDALLGIVNGINEAGAGPALYTTLDNIIGHLKEFDKGGSTGEKIQHWQKVKVLVIDEFSSTYTEWQRDMNWQILSKRFEGAMYGETATVFASNSPPEITSNDERMFSRFNYGAHSDDGFNVVEVTTPDLRRYQSIKR